MVGVSSIRVELEGMTKKPHGVGARIIQGTFTLTNIGSSVVNAKELGLRTIQDLKVQSTTPGLATLVVCDVNRPGSFDNTASVSVYRTATGSIVPDDGTVAVFSDIGVGTHAVRFMGMGE